MSSTSGNNERESGAAVSGAVETAQPQRWFTVVYSSKEALHNPEIEVHDGGILQEPFETSARCQIILKTLKSFDEECTSKRLNTKVQIIEPKDYGLAPILQVHDAHYVEFLRTAWDEWEDAGGREAFCHQTAKVFLASTYVLIIAFKRCPLIEVVD